MIDNLSNPMITNPYEEEDEDQEEADRIAYEQWQEGKYEEEKENN